MEQFPDTRISLILRLAEPADVQAWQEFSDIYAPALLALARRKGLQPADAEDVTQDILFGVARAVQRFEPDGDRAKFRTWLSRIARNLIADFFAGRRSRPVAQAISDSWLESVCTQPVNDADADLNQELRTATFRLAARRVRQRVAEPTWQAFELTAIGHRDPQAVAQQLDMTVGSVYVARCRVMRLLREQVQLLERASLSDALPTAEDRP